MAKSSRRPDPVFEEVAEEIIAKLCELFSSSWLTFLPKDMRSANRIRPVRRVRSACYLALYEYHPCQSVVARWINRDHSTVRHGLRLADKMMAEDKQFAENVTAALSHARRLEVRLRGPLVAAAFARKAEEKSARAKAERGELAPATAPA